MGLQLVRIEGGERGTVFPLHEREIVIGRDPSADLVVDVPRVSRRHALLQLVDERHQLTDLGSSNGTEVNGVPLRSPVLLQAGDRVKLGGEAELLYERRAAGGSLLRVAILVAGLAVCGMGIWAAGHFLTRAPGLPERAIELASQGLEAAREGDQAAAKARLQSAAGVLFREGELEGVPRSQLLRVAMRRLGGALEGDPNLWGVFLEALEATRPQPPAPSPKVGCRLDRVAAAQLRACLGEQIELVLVALWQDPGVLPPEFHRQVGAQLRREHAFLERALERGRPLVPKLRQAFEEARMPPLLHYVALIESGYRADAVSPAQALGLWQFMPATARHYGLRVGNGIDERRDVDKSTRAAVRYLKGLAFEFGGDALLLALAGYNRGENGVRRALKQLDDPFRERSYWVLVERGLLPRETALYVPRFVAAAVAGEAGLPDPARLAEAGY